MKVLLLLAQETDLVEAMELIEVLGWNKPNSDTSVDAVVCGPMQEIGRLTEEVVVQEYDALAIPGGFGEHSFRKDASNEGFFDVIHRFDTAGKVIASVCVGAIPSDSGVLTGGEGASTQLTVNGTQLQTFRMSIIDRPIIDASLITSRPLTTVTEATFRLLDLETRANTGL